MKKLSCHQQPHESRVLSAFRNYLMKGSDSNKGFCHHLMHHTNIEVRHAMLTSSGVYVTFKDGSYYKLDWSIRQGKNVNESNKVEGQYTDLFGPSVKKSD